MGGAMGMLHGNQQTWPLIQQQAWRAKLLAPLSKKANSNETTGSFDLNLFCEHLGLYSIAMHNKILIPWLSRGIRCRSTLVSSEG